MRHGVDDSGHWELGSEKTGSQGRDGSESHEVFGCIGASLDEAGGERALRVNLVEGNHQRHDQTAALVSHEADYQGQNNRQRNRLARVATLFASCSDDVETNECIKTCSSSCENLEKNGVYLHILAYIGIH